MGFEDGADDVRCVGGEDGEVGFALVVFGLAELVLGWCLIATKAAWRTAFLVLGYPLGCEWRC